MDSLLTDNNSLLQLQNDMLLWWATVSLKGPFHEVLLAVLLGQASVIKLPLARSLQCVPTSVRAELPYKNDCSNTSESFV